MTGKRIYGSNSDRQRAYRNRVKDKQHKDLVNPNGWISGQPITTEDQLLDYLDAFAETDIKWQCKGCLTYNYLLYPNCRHCFAPVEDSLRGSERIDFLEYFPQTQKFVGLIEERYRKHRAYLDGLNAR